MNLVQPQNSSQVGLPPARDFCVLFHLATKQVEIVGRPTIVFTGPIPQVTSISNGNPENTAERREPQHLLRSVQFMDSERLDQSLSVFEIGDQRLHRFRAWVFHSSSSDSQPRGGHPRQCQCCAPQFDGLGSRRALSIANRAQSSLFKTLPLPARLPLCDCPSAQDRCNRTEGLNPGGHCLRASEEPYVLRGYSEHRQCCQPSNAQARDNPVPSLHRPIRPRLGLSVQRQS